MASTSFALTLAGAAPMAAGKLRFQARAVAGRQPAKHLARVKFNHGRREKAIAVGLNESGGFPERL